MCDENQLKFCGVLKKHWEDLGHEVKFEMGASEILFEWCDLYYVEWWTHNLHYLFNWHMEHPHVKKPKIVCRAIDWDVWMGLARDQRIIDWVDTAISIAPHIKRKLEAEGNFGKKLKLGPLGVDTSVYKFIDRPIGFNVVIPCNEIDWHLKNVSEGMKIFALLKKTQPDKPWKLFIKGKWTQSEYFRVFHLDLLKKLNIEEDTTIVSEHVSDYDAFLDQMDYCLVPSYKEAFSYVTAECASKGIKPILNWWYGAEELWPREWLYSSVDEAVEMFKPYDRLTYSNYIKENHGLEKMLNLYDKIIFNK